MEMDLAWRWTTTVHALATANCYLRYVSSTTRILPIRYVQTYKYMWWGHAVLFASTTSMMHERIDRWGCWRESSSVLVWSCCILYINWLGSYHIGSWGIPSHGASQLPSHVHLHGEEPTTVCPYLFGSIHSRSV